MNEAEAKKYVSDVIERLNKEILLFYGQFLVYEKVSSLTEIHSVGINAAQTNAGRLSKYSSFYHAVRLATMHSHILGIARFYDQDYRSISIYNLIRFCHTHLDLLQEGSTRQIQMDNSLKHETLDIKCELTHASLREIELEIIRRRSIIKDVIKFRNKVSAHNSFDIDLEEFILLRDRVKELILFSLEVLNKIDSDFSSASTELNLHEKLTLQHTTEALEKLLQ